ncbi:Conserved_hypothetical protein [Hexamita inflata]|uniref:EF-hand domain-containing protein n=1 Tax=Hexamita inflata TaxID=28002 RepID=A0AA86N5U9_9EUKA|nr:Conserved hypothetical protein [Hexamita inflata]
MKVENINELFKQMDANGDGSLSLQEITQGLAKAGITVDAGKIQATFEAADTDKNGSIDPEEFVSFMAKI